MTTAVKQRPAKQEATGPARSGGNIRIVEIRNTYIFDIRRDVEICQVGGFFCQACLVGKPAADQSAADLRYCQGCYELLVQEAALDVRKASWKPKVPGGTVERHINGQQTTQRSQRVVPKPCDVESVLTQISEGVLARNFTGGRPRLELPVERIRQLSNQGMSAKDIFKELKSQGVEVGRRTVYRILAGQRSMGEISNA